MFLRSWLASRAIKAGLRANAVDLGASIANDVINAYVDPQQCCDWITYYIAFYQREAAPIAHDTLRHRL